MNLKKDSPSEIAKQTLLRLTKERRQPFPENYCDVFRKELGKQEPWGTYCRYTGLLEESFSAVVDSLQAPGNFLETETLRLARELEQEITAAASEDDLKRLREASRNLGLRIKREMASTADTQSELVNALQFAISNVDSLIEEDQTLHHEAMATETLLKGHIASADVMKAKELLRSILERQARLQRAMVEAQRTLKDIMAELIRQAGALVADSSGFEGKIGELGKHILAANDLPSIKDVVGELDGFVKDMGHSVRNAHANMSATQTRLMEAEQQIADLRKNLAETREKVRRDNLTGALNRSGLEEIWQQEVRLAVANATSLSVGILDVDNFKQLNDQLGHSVGDKALVHLTSVIRNALHGTDTVARYGGEEFVIVLPDTDAKGAKAVMQRLQRELTKHFFLRGNDRILITFSAGVTTVDLDSDSMLAAIERADTALYEAKRSGKNRVAVA